MLFIKANNMQLKKIAVLGLLGVTLSSQAALFDDKEARKKILSVEETSLASDKSHQAQLDMLKKNQADIEQRLASIERMLQNGGLVEIQNQIEALKRELAQVRGDLEVAQHNLENTQQRQKDLYTDTDTRLRRMESGASPSADSSTAGQSDELKQLAVARDFSDSAKYKEAFEAYDAFLKQYPNGQHTPDALYGMGYAQFALKSYKSSISTQQKLVDTYPDFAKAPEAMYNMANSQIQLNQITNAKKTLSKLIDKYPTAEITPSAQKRLKTLEALK
jgi:tol-pal system protein YbgF